MFNRRERIALLLLTGSLAVGGTVALLEYEDPSRFADFRVVRGAVAVPPGPVHGGESGEVAAVTAPEPRAPVALNSATATELERLPHVGPTTAARILEHRRRHGPFTTLESLTQIKGIGPRTLERLRPLVVLQ